MRILRPRFTLRSLVAAVVVSGVALGMAERSRRCDRLARDHAGREAASDLKAKQVMTLIGHEMIRTPGGGYLCRPIAGPGAEERQSRFLANAAHHHVLAEKYRAAAWAPWRPVAPDPPEPSIPEAP